MKETYDSDAPIAYDDEDRAEELYDPNDDAAVEAAWAAGTVTQGVRGKQKKATKELVSIRLSPGVLEHFKSRGKGWQTQIDQELLRVVERERDLGAKKAAG